MTTAPEKIDIGADIIDVRAMMARYEYIEYSKDWVVQVGEAQELRAVLDQLAGNGGDEQWRGDWYPVELIRDDYFQEYAKDLAEDTGAINPLVYWPNNCIDWERATRELQMDYTKVDAYGTTYWYR